MSEKYIKPIETEVCPECETEIELFWDVERQGYKAYCPICGNVMMLCDACRHAEDNPMRKCNFEYDHNGIPICFRRIKVREIPNVIVGNSFNKGNCSEEAWNRLCEVFLVPRNAITIEILPDKVKYTI